MINRFKIYGREEKCADGDLCHYEDVEAILNSVELMKTEILEVVQILKENRFSRDAIMMNRVIIPKLEEIAGVSKN